MFEKEAEEWVKKSVNENGHHFDSLIAQLEKQAYRKGAEFGYNKAKKEIEEDLLRCYQGYPEEESE